MAEMAYVCLYASYLNSLEPFTDAEIGKICKAMLQYLTTGKTPQFDGNERFIWPTIQSQIDRDIAAYSDKCSKNRENGSKGGRPPKNQTDIEKTERFLEKPKKAKEKEKEKEKEKAKEKEKEKEDNNYGADKPPRSRFSPPTIDEVRQYCLENNYTIDADRFVSYYESNGWMVGRNKMKSWKAAVRNWATKEKDKPKQIHESGMDRLARMYREEFGA